MTSGPGSAPGPDVPVYVISVAAELTGLHPQTLRSYDRLGLVRPGRTGGGGRRYSWRDIELLREVAELTSTGIGLEGVRRILELEHHVDALQRRVVELEQELAAAEYTLRQALDRTTTKNLPAVRATTPSGQSVTVWRRGRG
jgi:MerR family transcriptional regulator/heat shock protein HspR